MHQPAIGIEFNSSGIYWFYFTVVIIIIIIIQFRLIISVHLCTLFSLHLHSMHWLFLTRNIRDLQAKGPIKLSRFLAPFCPFCFCILCIHVNLFSDWSVHRGPGVAVLTALSSLATWGCHNYKLKCGWWRHGWGGGGSRLSMYLCMGKIWCTQWITCAKMANNNFEKPLAGLNRSSLQVHFKIQVVGVKPLFNCLYKS